MPRSPLSLRLPEQSEKKVRRLATLENRSLAETVRLLTEEALKTREFPDIVFTDGPTGRRASFRGGPDVWEVIDPYLFEGEDWQALRESHPDLDESMLRTAIRYYEAYPDEIRVRIEANHDSI